MFLKELKLKNYRLFDDITVSFRRGMNVLIGKNSTGKSTILEAIDFLLNNTANTPVEEIIPYTKRSYQSIQILVQGIFEISEIEKLNIVSFLINDSEKELFSNSHLEIKYSKRIIKHEKGVYVEPNIQIDGNGLSNNQILMQQAINYLFPKIQTNNILTVVDQEKEISQQSLLPIAQLIQMLPRQSTFLNQYVRNMLYKAKQENINEYNKIKTKIIDAYPEMVDLDVEFDPNRAQIQIYFKTINSKEKIPLESEGRGIREYFYLFLTLYYFSDTIIIKDEALVHMHKSLLNDFIASINELKYQMITTSHIKELIETLDFGNIIICRKHNNGETIVKNLRQIEEMETVLDELGYSIEENSEMNEFLSAKYS
jgi:predicted ATP-dependent endonuclease of OLD family